MKDLTQLKRPRLSTPKIPKAIVIMESPSKSMTDNAKLYYALPPRPIQPQHSNGCPKCGDYEGDEQACPNGCHDVKIPKGFEDFNPTDLRSESNEPSMRGE